MAEILIIEDDAMMRVYSSSILQLAGHRVSEAEDGAKGLARLKLGPVDLVITDLVMPKQKDIETVTAIRAEFPQVKILVVSGSPDSEAYRNATALLGPRRVLPKPFTSRQLTDRVDEVLFGEGGA
jgi:DNA-binding response OmpR family regulator